MPYQESGSGVGARGRPRGRGTGGGRCRGRRCAAGRAPVWGCGPDAAIRRGPGGVVRGDEDVDAAGVHDCRGGRRCLKRLDAQSGQPFLPLGRQLRPGARILLPLKPLAQVVPLGQHPGCDVGQVAVGVAQVGEDVVVPLPVQWPGQFQSLSIAASCAARVFARPGSSPGPPLRRGLPDTALWASLPPPAVPS